MSSRSFRCAIYTRKSTENGLEQDFNSLHAQREACEAYVRSQASAGWRLIKGRYDDGGISGATMERPALKLLLEHIAEGKVDIVVVYKIDRLTRSLMDFARMVELFDRHQVSFVSVTQQFNTTTSMGRLNQGLPPQAHGLGRQFLEDVTEVFSQSDQQPDKTLWGLAGLATIHIR
jgi:site-specific DNA recombinase